jgi:heme exporter protein D
MKNTERITIALSLAIAVVAFMTGAPITSAQTTTLTCLPATSTVAPGTNVTFLVNGSANLGPLTFSGGGITTTTTTTPTFTTSFPNSGINTFTVTAGGQAANCSVNVQPTASGAVACVLPTSSIVAGTSATFSAIGGNGTFAWSASDLNISNPAGTTFSATYTTPGIHTLNVSSNGQVASCSFDVLPAAVTGTPSPTPVSCRAISPTVTVGQTASFTAAGGNGVYVWSASDLNISNPTGTGFSANYAGAGLHTLTVTSNGQSATCSVTVLPLSTPGLPNTGFAPAQ